LASAPTLSDFLLSLPRFKDLSPRALILLVAFHMFRGGQTNFSRAELVASLGSGGVPPPSRLAERLGQLSRMKTSPLLRVTGHKYALSLFGQKEIQEYLETTHGSVVARTPIQALTVLVGKISGDAEKRFFAEAIACLEVDARRASVVMVWSITLDHLQRYVLGHKLAEFNAAWAVRGDCGGRRIVVQDDFLEIRNESTFIDILRVASIITKDIRRILDEKLGFRNTCAHPNDVVIPESKVLAAIEDLVYNVLLKYPL
jgi:hypothetical protein